MLDQSVLVFITLVLVAAVGYSVWQSRKREPFEEYNETSCVALAQTNDANIKELLKKAETIEDLVTQISAIKSQTEANSESISTYVKENKP
jgi:hypothetical protein